MKDYSNYEDAQGRYLHDQHFKTLVDTMHLIIRDGKFTPSELRDAVILAATHYETHSLRARESIFKKDTK